MCIMVFNLWEKGFLTAEVEPSSYKMGNVKLNSKVEESSRLGSKVSINTVSRQEWEAQSGFFKGFYLKLLHFFFSDMIHLCQLTYVYM